MVWMWLEKCCHFIRIYCDYFTNILFDIPREIQVITAASEFRLTVGNTILIVDLYMCLCVDST